MRLNTKLNTKLNIDVKLGKDINIDEYQEVLKYIIDQADRYDSKNLQFEQDIKFNIKRSTQVYLSNANNAVLTNIDSQLKLQQLMMSLTKLMHTYETTIYNNLYKKLPIYYDMAYNNMADLIEIGKEVSGNFSENTKEIEKQFIYSKEAIDVAKEHAFELMKGYDYAKLEEIRSKLTNLMLSGKADKATVRTLIQDTLKTTLSKAESVAQTELNRIYNMGSMTRLNEFQQISGEIVYKYWHGFLYSPITCPYCRERIGGVYDINDDTEVLPAHVNCRCVWLPLLQSWNGKTSRSLILRANMLNTAYSTDMLYNRINNRLGIDYAKYLSKQAVVDYIAGDRSEKIIKSLSDARTKYISDIKTSYNIKPDTSNGPMSNEFNQQMNFWKQYTAESMADGNIDALNRSYEAIKGVMLLQWNGEQLNKWNTLLEKIK